MTAMVSSIRKNNKPIQQVISDKDGIVLGDARQLESSRRLKHFGGFAAVLVVLLLALWFRAPLVKYGSPFIYDEDEGHHFNRVLMMLKTGDFNPRYFLKPALHFYLRLPVTAVGFLKGVEQGQLRELKEIQTKNPYSLAGYEFTASHPILLKFNRAFSVAIALVTILLTFVIAESLAGRTAGILAALLLALSPGHIEMSANIGVDMQMAMFVLLSVALSVHYLKSLSRWSLTFAALTAGLAVASKYNAFLVCIVPALAFLISKVRGLTDTEDSDVANVGAASTPPFAWLLLLPLLCGLGFLVGAPYSLIELPKFLNGAAYEVWHYSDGHSINKAGLAQFTFYMNWFVQSGVGLGVLIVATFGLVASLVSKNIRWTFCVVALFPVIYFTYMCQQKANFPRNMVVMLPFVCIFAASGLLLLKDLIARLTLRLNFDSKVTKAITVSVFVAAIALPTVQAMKARNFQVSAVDTRLQLEEWLKQSLLAGERVAISGELAVPHPVRKLSGITEIRFSELATKRPTLEQLWSEGYNYLVIPSYLSKHLPANAEIVKTFAGNAAKQRVQSNPSLEVVKLSTGVEQTALSYFRGEQFTANVTPASGINSRSSFLLDMENNQGFGAGWSNFEQVKETQTVVDSSKVVNHFRWMNGRYASLVIERPRQDTLDLIFIVKSLAPAQQLQVFVDRNLQGQFEVSNKDWSEKIVAVKLTEAAKRRAEPLLIEFLADKVVLPSVSQNSRDTRSLSVAINSLELKTK